MQRTSLQTAFHRLPRMVPLRQCYPFYIYIFLVIDMRVRGSGQRPNDRRGGRKKPAVEKGPKTEGGGELMTGVDTENNIPPGTAADKLQDQAPGCDKMVEGGPGHI